MRYFNFCFTISLGYGVVQGEATYTKGQFPARSEVIDFIKSKNAKYKEANPTITAIYEFKSKEDFDNWES